MGSRGATTGLGNLRIEGYSYDRGILGLFMEYCRLPNSSVPQSEGLTALNPKPYTLNIL